MIVLPLQLEKDGAGNHVRRMRRCPLEIPKEPLPDEGDELFEQIKAQVKKTLPWDFVANAWIHPGTWAIINERASLRIHNLLTQRMSRHFYRRIRAALKNDRIERARRAGEAVVTKLINCKVKAAWHILRDWYRAMEGKAGKSCHHRMDGAADGGKGGTVRLRAPRR